MALRAAFMSGSAVENTARHAIEAGESFLTVLAARRSVRDFTSDVPPRELIMCAIEAATHAPSGMNKQPWTPVARVARLVRDRAAYG